MAKKKETRGEQAKRTYRKTIVFNETELRVIKFFIAKYKIRNQSKLFRESIISAILRKMDEDHPRLF